MGKRLPLLIGTVMLVAGCQRTPSSSVRVDPALASLVPADTAILVGATLDKLRETPVYQKHFSEMALPRLDRFARETGIDPRRDIWEVLFSSNGADSAVLMVRGKFETGQLEPKLERKGATRTEYKGYGLYGDERTSVFFMNSSTGLAGSTPLLKTIIDSRDGSRGGIPPGLQPLVDAVPQRAQVWAVFNGSAVTLPFAGRGALGNFDQVLRSIQNGRFSADLSSGFDFQATGTCTNDQSAKQIRDLLKGLIGIGRLSTGEDQPEMLRLYDSINVEQEANVVNVAADVPQELVDRFVDMFVARRR